MPASIAINARIVVVTPCFNDGETLLETVDSVRACRDCEHVVVDDGSSDPRTLSVLDQLERTGIKVLRQANRGPASARSAGLRATTAPFVFPLDADDLVVADVLADLAAALDHSPTAALAWGDIQFFGESDRLARCPAALDPWLITYLNPLPYASLIRRSALEEIGGWGPVSGFEDWDLWMGFAERGKDGIHVPGPVLRYRIHGNRRWRGNFRRQGEILGELRARHPRLFAARSVNRRRSAAPWRLKVLLPLIDTIPGLGQANKARLFAGVLDPREFLSRLVARLSGR
jgi:glycosyltransferase involved in cell wall biosynthesis